MAVVRSCADPDRVRLRFPKPHLPDQDDIRAAPVPPAMSSERKDYFKDLTNPSAVLSLQHAIGNCAVQRLLAEHGARSHKAIGEPGQPVLSRKETDNSFEVVPQITPVTSAVLQRALWANAPAKFRTDNDLPGIRNSEYLVTSDGYLRYAPINMMRSMDQVFHEGHRSFMYLYASEAEVYGKDYRAIWNWPLNIEYNQGDTVTIKSPDYPAVVGHIMPKNGSTVFDVMVDESTKSVTSKHVGHPVTELGKPLPTLDDPDAVNAARDYQGFLIEQSKMLKEHERLYETRTKKGKVIASKSDFWHLKSWIPEDVLKSTPVKVLKNLLGL